VWYTEITGQILTSLLCLLAYPRCAIAVMESL